MRIGHNLCRFKFFRKLTNADTGRNGSSWVLETCQAIIVIHFLLIPNKNKNLD